MFYIKRDECAKDLPMPKYATDFSSGMDLASCEPDFWLHVGERYLCKTGISIALPLGYEAQIRPRSGLAYRNGVTVLNSPGTIDEDYRGEIRVLLYNAGEIDFQVMKGMRIAQMVISAVIRPKFLEVLDLPDTKRGAGGFGSTGI